MTGVSNIALITVAWLAVAVHIAAAIATRRRLSDLPLVPLVNLGMAVCVLIYWAQRWHGYLARGVTWYATDQLLPLYALLVCALAALTLGGRYAGTLPHWVIFGVHAVGVCLAALFLTFFRIGRLF